MDHLATRIDHLQPPPRRVPLALICASLSGVFTLFGSVFFSFGMIFVWVFGAGQRPLDAWRLSRAGATAPALVEEVEGTGGYENEVQIFRYRFRVLAGDGTGPAGTCYTTGGQWQAGDRVRAVYLPEDPAVACLEGARLSDFPWWVMLFVGIFPAIGLGFLIPSTIGGLRRIQLLRHGLVAAAGNLRTETTNTRINNVPVMRYRYEFRDLQGMVRPGSSSALPTVQVGDEAAEPVLYLPARPRQSLLVDTLSLRHRLEIGPGGGWVYPGPVKAVLVCLLQWVPVFAHVAAGLVMLFL